MKKIKYIDIFDKKELPELVEGYRYLDFIGGTKNYRYFIVPFNTPRCELLKNNINLLDACLIPIYEKEGVVIRQDPSYPLPGFYILSYEKQYSAFDLIDLMTHLRTSFLLHYIRKGMRKHLNIKYIHLYYDEQIQKSYNVHYWLLPVQEKNSKNVKKIYDLELKKYLEKFEYQTEKDIILKYNDIMRKYIKNIKLEELDSNFMKLLKQGI